MKRKRDEAHRKEEEVKKVCKEGLQLFHHNVCLLLFLQSDASTREYDSQRRGRTPPSHVLFVCLGLPVLRGYVAARRGEREEMQDAHVLLPDMSGCLSTLPGNV